MPSNTTKILWLACSSDSDSKHVP